VSWKTYRPNKGDTLESIAKKHGLSLAQLKEVNGIPARTRTVPSLLVVPLNAAASSGMHKLPIMYAPPIPIRTQRIFHTVRAGETFASIAKRYGVAIEDLKRWNPINKLAAGQKLAVEVRAPTKSKGKPRPKAKGKTYKKADR